MIAGKGFKFEDLSREIESTSRKVNIDSQELIETKSKAIAWLQDKEIVPPNDQIKNKLVCFIAETADRFKDDKGRFARVKGLSLFGNAGTGKTFAGKIISVTREFRFFKSDDLVELFKDDRNEFVKIMKSNNPIIIDDIGAEETLIEYGRKTEVVQYAISLRSDAHTQYGALSVFTSNLDNDSFKSRYGDRSYSRIRGMCECCVINGKDIRL